MCRILTTSVPSTTSKQCFEQPAASFLVCSLIFIEYKITFVAKSTGVIFLSDDKCVIIGSKRGEEMNQTVECIKELTAIESPTGFTREISDYLVKTLEGFGYQPVRTAKGGVNVTIKGQMMNNNAM